MRAWQARDGTLAPRCRRDVTDGALGGSAEGQGARATSSGGENLMVRAGLHVLDLDCDHDAVTP